MDAANQTMKSTRTYCTHYNIELWAHKEDLRLFCEKKYVKKLRIFGVKFWVQIFIRVKHLTFRKSATAFSNFKNIIENNNVTVSTTNLCTPHQSHSHRNHLISSESKSNFRRWGNPDDCFDSLPKRKQAWYILVVGIKVDVFFRVGYLTLHWPISEKQSCPPSNWTPLQAQFQLSF